MTDQELMRMIFNKVKDHLLSQRKRSSKLGYDGYSINCMYRGPNGLKCSIGCLIKDEYFNLRYNTCSVHDEEVIHMLAPSLGVEERQIVSILGFLNELQKVHDIREVDNWEIGLDLVEREYLTDEEV